jgi:N-acetylglucosamine-6-sulfatase
MSPQERAAWNAHFEPANALYRQKRDAGELVGEALTRWKFQRYLQDYLACINGVDKSVGQVLAWLESSGLAENTSVIYSSDQGFYLGEHGWYDKRWMFEPSLRLPLILRWPGVVAAGSTDAHLVQKLDLAPTFLDLAGAEIPGDMQGRSLVPLFRGETPTWRDAIYYEYYEKGVHNVPPHYGVRTERYKLIRYDGLDAWELFDLDADPSELHSVADEAQYVEVRRGLELRLAQLRIQYKR